MHRTPLLSAAALILLTVTLQPVRLLRIVRSPPAAQAAAESGKSFLQIEKRREHHCPPEDMKQILWLEGHRLLRTGGDYLPRPAPGGGILVLARPGGSFRIYVGFHLPAQNR